MKKLFLVSILAALLLFAGCIQTQGQKVGDAQKPETKTGAGVAGEEQQVKEEEPAGKEAGRQQQNYDEMAIGALMNLGVPIKCTITYNYPQGGIRGNVVEYMLNKKIRIETQQTVEGMTTDNLVIAKDEGTYVQLTPEMKTGGGVYANCDWLFYPPEKKGQSGYEVSEDERVGAEYESLGYEYTLHCEPAMFGEEKFATPGNVCNLEEMMNNPCASIEDPEVRAQCEEAMAGQ